MWKVFKTKIEIFPHENADSLELGKVGTYQVVVAKGLYKTGDDVVFVPSRSILPPELAEGFQPHLHGAAKNRVGQVRLRGELSEGVILPLEGADFPYGEDISAELGIEEYIPEVPMEMFGEVEPFPSGQWESFDLEQYGIYRDQFEPDEDVVVTCKIHGSQVQIMVRRSGSGFLRMLSSKGVFSRLRSHILPNTSNLYWQAAENTEVFDLLEDIAGQFPDATTFQAVGEVFPAQGGGWSYGQKKPTLRVFDVKVDGESVPLMKLRNTELFDLWVPVLYEGVFSDADLSSLSRGKEQISGEELHIREGAVLRPAIDRLAGDLNPLMVKIINPKYAAKETGEELS